MQIVSATWKRKPQKWFFFFNAQGGVKLYNSIPASFYFFHSMCLCVCDFLTIPFSSSLPHHRLQIWLILLHYVLNFLKCYTFDLWCWRRLLRVPWTARTSNQSILKEINPEYSLEGLMLKLKLQYFGHLIQRADSLEKTLMLGKTEGRRRSRWQRMRWLGGIIDKWKWVWASSRRCWRETWNVAVHGVVESDTT